MIGNIYQCIYSAINEQKCFCFAGTSKNGIYILLIPVRDKHTTIIHIYRWEVSPPYINNFCQHQTQP